MPALIVCADNSGDFRLRLRRSRAWRRTLGTPHPRRRHRRLWSTVWLAGLMLSAALALAQPPVAQLRGGVVDDNGLPVRAVEVTLQSSSGQTETAYTDAFGRFEISSLAPGEYRLSLKKPGFRGTCVSISAT